MRYHNLHNQEPSRDITVIYEPPQIFTCQMMDIQDTSKHDVLTIYSSGNCILKVHFGKQSTTSSFVL